MHQEVFQDAEKRKALGYRDRERHAFNADLLQDYFDKLSGEGHFEKLPPVKLAILRQHKKNAKLDIARFKKVNYHIVDKERFEIEKIE